MNQLKHPLFSSPPFIALTDAAGKLDNSHPVVVSGAAGSLVAFMVAALFEGTGRQIVAVAADDDAAETLRDDCALLIGEEAVRFFGARPMHYSQSLDMSSSIAQIETLKALTGSVPRIIIASAASLAERIPSPKHFTETIIELKSGGETDFTRLIERLYELGFEKKDFVEGYGDFAVRGGILDVFPFVGENPVRFEFWGNTIESIREFDALSQRSIRTLEVASIVPDPSPHDASETDGHQTPTSLSGSLFDYLNADALLLLDDQSLLEREISQLIGEGKQQMFEWQEVERRIATMARIVRAAVHARGAGQQIDFGSSPQPPFGGSVRAAIEKIVALNAEGYTVYLASDSSKESTRLQELIEETLTDPNASAMDENEPLEILRFGQNDDAIKVSLPKFELLHPAIHSGFIFPAGKVAVFTEHEIFGRLKRRGIAKRKRFNSISQKELQQLKPGDYIVHADHGIGTFSGLTKISVGGAEQEVMKVAFLENDILYVNLNFVNRVQKYASKEGHVPKLTRLGSAEWDKLKARAKKRIKDIARDLIALYAKRKAEPGFAFSPDSHWQKELEASFMYEDTPDQATATLDVKRDMESSSPMDRLVCGDVGFGKTEVAVRAAFKAVQDGKQAAVLVPTTILAIQHYNTFRDRMQRFGARIENLTRFKSKKEQTAVVDLLAKGAVDIIIGTHRLLSKDVAFKDLGLLIIDEEHRFGVTAKEKLRKFKATVDTLTLTATPIPRTLHFSLIGARDLSLINTPPRNRLPISTEIVPADGGGLETHWRVVREAILHELHRGGQIYFVHDRVENIDTIAGLLRTRVPEARIHIAHGQMDGHELEQTMLDFLEKKYDVLVCTKIIESGLDIPSVNTIILNRAERFGMAELYQLRGRVGRSNVQAYAYLLTPPLSVIPRTTLRRLQAIEEFAELGSGFNLAMRDLEIRGTGNLLGGEQSGFIMEMGFEMYERIVRESVEELKSEEFKEVFEHAAAAQGETAAVPAKPVSVEELQTQVDAPVEALLPEFYIESDSERLDVYRRLYRAQSAEEIHGIRDELRDRFGEYPEEVENLFLIVELRAAAGTIGFRKAELGERSLALTLPEQTRETFYGKEGDADTPFQRLMAAANSGWKSAPGKKSEPLMKLKQDGNDVKLMVALTAGAKAQERLKEGITKLNELNERVHAPTI